LSQPPSRMGGSKTSGACACSVHFLSGSVLFNRRVCVDELPVSLGAIRGRGDVIHLLIHRNRCQPFRRGGPLQLNRDGLFRIALDSLCGTAMDAIGEILHDARDNLRLVLLLD